MISRTFIIFQLAAALLLSVLALADEAEPAAEQERRLICHSDGSCNRGPSSFIQRFFTMTSGCGKNFLKSFFAMMFVLSALI